MKPQLSDEEIKNIRWTTIHYLHGTEPRVRNDAKMAFDELLMYKSQVEKLQKALEQAKEFLSELYFLVGQDMDINPSAKKVYLSKIAYANNTFISQALERSEPHE